MAKQEKPLRTVHFDLDSKPLAPLPLAKEVEASLSQIQPPKTSSSSRRLPLTTAISAKHRAELEALATERKLKLADVLEEAIALYLAQNPIKDQELLQSLIKIFERR